MSGCGGVRDSISVTVKKTILNIKEITGSHSEDEIYAMLKECGMDPNETAQKLLLQDPFHEVKRKRDRRKENPNNKESTEPRWRPGTQGRGNKGGRANFSSRYTSHDVGGAKNSSSGRDSGTKQVAVKVADPAPPKPQETKSKELTPQSSSSSVLTNGPADAPSGNSIFVHTPISAGTHSDQPKESTASVDINKLGGGTPPVDVSRSPSVAFGTEDTMTQTNLSSSNSSASLAHASSSAICFSTSDPVLELCNDSRLPGAVGTIKREVGLNRTSNEQHTIVTSENNLPSKSIGIGKTQPIEPAQLSSSSTQSSTSVSRPSSNYGVRSQQTIGPQKVGSNKEWKPKPTNPNAGQGSLSSSASDVPFTRIEANVQSLPVLKGLDSEEAASKLQKKLNDLHLPQRQHVIIPNHIHVPESERSKLSFGSFDATFGVSSSYVSSGPESESSSTPQSEASQAAEEIAEEQAASSQAILTNTEGGDYREHPPALQAPESLSGEGDVSTTTVPEYNESKQDAAVLPGGHPNSMVNTSPNYGFGFVPPVLGSQVASFENSESQAREVSRLPNFVVQQPFDPASYYAQFYRSGPDGDGRISPFISPGVASKYNGSIPVLPTPASQPPQEGGNSLGLSTTGPTPIATQGVGAMQSSMSVTQTPVPVFRPPAGMHISHYPPNYIPYGHYFSPFYVPPPAIHQFLSNGAFPQQPQASNVYPAPPPGAPAGVKYSIPQQYKPGTNTGNTAHMGMPSAYGPYGSSPAGYNPGSTATAGNSAANEEHGASQFKENNVYHTGQQSEGSTVWIAAPGREMSNVPGGSFYNLPPQGPHVTYAPTQPGHGAFASIYHPGQAVTAAAAAAAAAHPLLQQTQTMAGAVDMTGPASNVYQPPQHAQMNWPSNY